MLIRLDEVISKYKPVNEIDYEQLFKYKNKVLFRMLKYDDEHRDKIVDHLFFKLTDETQIEEFKNVLKELNMYDTFVNIIKESDNDKYKQHLVLFYENDLIDELYKSEYNLAKHIYKNRKKAGAWNCCYEHLFQLASIANERETLLLIKKQLVKLIKNSTKAKYILNLEQLLLSGRKIGEKDLLSIKDREEFLIKEFTEEVEKLYVLNKRNKKGKE